MTITIEKATANDAEAIHAMQVKSFLPLLDKYKDTDTNPACELIDKTLHRIERPSRGFYKILRDGTLVGGIAIKQIDPKIIFLGPIFVDPIFQNQKIAQKALSLIEDVFSEIDFFELATFAQEEGNVHLYEKVGYVATGEHKKISDSLEVIFFRKNLRP
jgi:RimJ/RimL family protein N-acetyltransferase